MESKFNYRKLTSQHHDVLILNAQIQTSAIFAGLLAIHSDTRAKLATDNFDIDLYDRSNFITRVRLTTEMGGERNGYLANTLIQIV